MTDVQKWADKAMFSAEPMPEGDRPTVKLIWMTPDPLGAIAAVSKMYLGEVCTDLSEITDEERIRFFKDGTKTVLGAPFENVQFHFLIQRVTRGFTHQLVRQRTATYWQESTRFAVIDENFAGRVGLPPSLEGTSSAREHLAWLDELGLDHETNTGSSQRKRMVWDQAVEQIERAYKVLVDSGMPAEDARGLLPTNLLTRVHYRTNLRDLVEHAGNRLCTQAQFEWRYVFNAIVEAIGNARVYVPTMRGVDGNGNWHGGTVPVYMANRLASLFKPVCYQRGTCGFQASFDRPCSIRDRVLANAAEGRPSSEWHLPFVSASGLKDIGPIHPAEWALDPSAARS